MAAFPSTILTVPPVALPGMFADNGIKDIVSRVALNATIAPGLLAIYFAADAENGVRAPTLTGQVSGANAQGIVVYDPTAPNNPYAIGDMVPVMKKGRIWVNVEEAVTPASTVFVRFAAGSFAVLGAFRASADTATAVALPSAKYVTTQATIGGLAVVEINLP